MLTLATCDRFLVSTAENDTLTVHDFLDPEFRAAFSLCAVSEPADEGLGRVGLVNARSDVDASPGSPGNGYHVPSDNESDHVHAASVRSALTIQGDSIMRSRSTVTNATTATAADLEAYIAFTHHCTHAKRSQFVSCSTCLSHFHQISEWGLWVLGFPHLASQVVESKVVWAESWQVPRPS